MVLPIVLAAVAAVVWGTSDFAGGKASQRAGSLAVTVVSQLLSLPVLAACVLLVPGEFHPADLAWGGVAGSAGLAGIVLLYRALASGAMSVVAPVTSVTAAVVPMGVGLAMDRTPGMLSLGGAGCALVAIALVSLGPTTNRGATSHRPVSLAVAAGLLFGIFFVLVSKTSADGGMWSLVGVRFTSVALGLAAVARTGTSLRLPRPVLGWAALAGPLDVIANVFYVAAAVRGHLSVVAVIASLGPASTVLLALAVDRERLRVVQVAGLGLAAAALVLTAS